MRTTRVPTRRRRLVKLLAASTLPDAQFEWDKRKAASNWRNHGVTFEQGQKAFRDPFAVETIDDREDYGEERVNLIGMGDSALLHVTFIERGERIRIIPARRAERHEQDDYFRANAP